MKPAKIIQYIINKIADISVDNTYGCQCTYQSEYVETQLARDLTDLFVDLDNSEDLSTDRNTDNPII